MSSKNLVYHKIFNTSNFEKHLELLDGSSVLLTFDDGDRSFYENAFPLIRRFKIPTILFVITELIGTSKPFWWDEVVYHLGDQEGKKEISFLKSIPNDQRLLRLDSIRTHSRKPPLEYPQLTLDELKEMNDEGIIIANHSHSHPMFDQLTEEEISIELAHTKDFFNNLGLGKYDWFAYPNGNFSPTSEKVLAENGINKAFLFDHRLQKGNNHMRISRLSVNDNTPLWKLKFILSGWHSKMVPMRKKIHDFIK